MLFKIMFINLITSDFFFFLFFFKISKKKKIIFIIIKNGLTITIKSFPTF
ncbi:hypothetical protein DDB_G0276175 [Dictyostelium discoideum AX4]|uniref:Uncharacterized protein n=1 Tax=Dictyostelium discoideum TaxID=44689 RepID=Q552B0_DICDI|nr:hypothetical protein DDB_G0276175 [Dictyostelium discoideum AX4]EAL69387.1 hypothetical protein DDB_G0276175 [Dictyostelium discoideum AX4]|eukprot:XP_643318.1 hypothetical protein DDB_G0276175 [Dictyostelium discoideum AX4]